MDRMYPGRPVPYWRHCIALCRSGKSSVSAEAINQTWWAVGDSRARFLVIENCTHTFWSSPRAGMLACKHSWTRWTQRAFGFYGGSDSGSGCHLCVSQSPAAPSVVPGSPGGQSCFQNNTETSLTFFSHSFTSPWWDFPQVTWCVMTSSLVNVCSDTLVFEFF